MEKTILIISNRANVRDMLANTFSESGFRVSLAGSGEEAAKIVMSSPVDWVLCEQFLPDGSGIELKKRLLRISPNSRMIVTSSFSVIRSSDDVLRFGSSDFIVDQRELIDLIRAAGEERSPMPPPVTQDRLKRCLIDTIDVLVGLLEMNDPFFGGNSHITMEYARAVAEELKLTQDVVDEIVVASLLHDIGRVGIRTDILKEKKDLSKEEFETIKSHCENGAKILDAIDFPWKVKPIIIHHHERFDGKGYPGGLKGREIPVGARILAVVDAFAAITANRSYRRSLKQEEAIRELHKNVGTQFDPEIVEIFTLVVKKQFSFRGIGSRPKVLLVDDEVDYLTLLKLKLLNEGFDVLTTNNGKDALLLLEREAPDLVVSDVVMPGLDGLELFRTMRGTESITDVPLIFLSGRSDTRMKVEALHLGAEDFLVKPVDLRELAARIRNVIRRDARRKTEAAATGTNPGVMGDLKNLGIPEIVQTLHLGLKTASVTIHAGTPEEARFFFSNGRIRHAETGDLSGEEAFYRILRHAAGPFVIAHGTTTKERTIDRDEMQLILEGFRRIDEEKKEQAPG